MLLRIFFCLSLVLTPGIANAQQKLTVLLDWFVNPDHAPLIVAKAEGWFADAGLDVELVPPADPSAPPRLVAAGQADLAISYQPQLHVQVDEGLPVVRIGTLAETPLNSLVVLEQSGIQSPADLKGKTIGYSVGGFEDALLGAMLRKYDLGLEDVELVNINFALSPSLITGRVDGVIGAFRNFELNQLDIEGHPGKAFYPEEEGVPAYDELILLSHRDEVGDPRFRIFLDVLEEATLYLTNHPEQAWETFIAAHPDLDNELNIRAWRDTLPRLAKRPAALDRKRYERFARFMKEAGLIEEVAPLDSYAIELQ